MNTLLLLIVGVGTICVGSIEAYTVLEEAKGDNHSIATKYEEIAEDTRKRLSGHKRYDVRQRPYSGKDSGLESIVLAINTGAKPNSLDKATSNFIQKLENLISRFMKDERIYNMYFRSSKDTDIVRPEIVHFRSGKPSLMVEINFESVLRGLREALNSKKVKHFADKCAQKAALVYRAIKYELDKGN
ncbi:unnamed protein product [Parnassius apollo]|uniref:(apollo) hypothetical protein n=1 Tax=Parnassius apollo TaxID=110799 RepID=A0A8S3X413_PARAO|nr:unnamed protein product [Parnassius apollo]